MILAIFKILLFLVTLLVYIPVSLLAELVVRDERKKLHLFMRITSVGCSFALWVFGIKVTVKNLPEDKSILHRSLVVCNHVSYLDILIISSVFPSLYITSVEVQRTFFLGLLARLAGSLFVERRSKTKLLQEIDRIADVLKKGFTITLFPEGTSSNGERVLPFKGALFSTAEKAGSDILPICMRYTSINGEPVSPKNRDLAFYYGDIEFFPHLIKLFFVKNMKVTLKFLQPIKYENSDRKEVVDKVFTSISETYSTLA